MTVLKKALDETIKQFTAAMSVGLQSNAHADGWDPNIASNMQVKFHDGKMTAELPEEHSDQAHTYEYGTETQRPLATVRKYANRVSNQNEMFGKLFEKNLGKYYDLFTF